MAKKNYKVDIFKAFEQINKENYDYFNHLSDEETKELSGYVLMRWMVGAAKNNEIHTILTNEYMNPYVFTLQKHPVLIYKLCIAANGGIDNTHYKFKKKPAPAKEDLLVSSVMWYYTCNVDEAKQYKELLSDDDLKEIKEAYDNTIQ